MQTARHSTREEPGRRHPSHRRRLHRNSAFALSDTSAETGGRLDARREVRRGAAGEMDSLSGRKQPEPVAAVVCYLPQLRLGA